MKRHKIDLFSLAVSIPFIVVGALYVGGDAQLRLSRADWLIPLAVITAGLAIIASTVRALGGRTEPGGAPAEPDGARAGEGADVP